MSTLKRKLTGILLLAVLLAVCTGFLIVQTLTVNSVPYHGEGYADPASAIHIVQSGGIINVPANYSSITRDGNVYTLTSNVTRWVIIEKSNIVLDGDGFFFNGSHGLSLSDVSNVTVRNLNITTHYLDLLLEDASDCTIQNVISDILLRGSNQNLVFNCTCDIELEQSDENTVKNCVTGKLSLRQSNGNSFLYNTIWTQGVGIGFWQSSNNLVFGNTFEKFWWWISISGDDNKIVANNVWAGQIYTEDKLDGTNYIYYNNFFNFNWDQSADTNSASIWSSAGKGNYYGVPMGPDTNHDGVGDYPYVIDKTNTDEYPLMSPVDTAAEHLP